MNLTVLGLSARDAQVFDLFMQRNFPAWQWCHVAANREAKMGDVQHLVLDLAAHGWAQGNIGNLRNLQQCVGNCPVVLLVSSQDHTWVGLSEAQQVGHWIWLAKPYGTERMRDALNQLVVMGAARSSATPVARFVEPPILLSTPQTHKLADALETPPTLDADGLASLLTGTQPERFTLLRQLLARLRESRPFELRFTVQNSLIVHPKEGWAATNTPVQVICRVCDSNALAAAVVIRDLEPGEALARAHRLGMPLGELDVFLHAVSGPLLSTQVSKLAEADR